MRAYRHSILGLVVLVAFVVAPSKVYAIPPPDFIFNIGTQLFQTFGICCFVLSSIFGAAYYQTRALLRQYRLAKIVTLCVAALLFSGLFALLYEIIWA